MLQSHRSGECADTALRDKHLTKCATRLRQEDSALENPNVMSRASVLRGAGHGHLARPGISGKDDSTLTEYLGSPGRAIRNMPIGCQLVQGCSVKETDILKKE